jgi:hypothetical protein
MTLLSGAVVIFFGLIVVGLLTPNVKFLVCAVLHSVSDMTIDFL